MNYYAFHIGDYASATRHLSWAEDAAYRRMLDAYYTREAPLPLDPRQVYRLVVATTEEQRQAVDSVLAEFFVRTDDGWRHSRCDTEIDAANAKKAKASQSALKRWKTEKAAHGNALSDANDMPSQCEGNANAQRSDANACETTCEGNAPNPNPNPIKEKKSARSRATSFDAEGLELPAWLSRELWIDWVRERRQRGKPITERAAAQQLRSLDEFRGAGHSPERVIGHAIASGNQGLYPPPVVRAVPVGQVVAPPPEAWKPPPPMTAEEREASDKARRLAMSAVKIITKANA